MRIIINDDQIIALYKESCKKGLPEKFISVFPNKLRFENGLKNLIAKVFDIIKEESKNYNFALNSIEIHLDYLSLPYVYVWIENSDHEMNKCYKERDFLDGKKINPSFSYDSNFSKFILDFKTI